MRVLTSLLLAATLVAAKPTKIHCGKIGHACTQPAVAFCQSLLTATVTNTVINAGTTTVLAGSCITASPITSPLPNCLKSISCGTMGLSSACSKLGHTSGAPTVTEVAVSAETITASIFEITYTATDDTVYYAHEAPNPDDDKEHTEFEAANNDAYLYTLHPFGQDGSTCRLFETDSDGNLGYWAADTDQSLTDPDAVDWYDDSNEDYATNSPLFCTVANGVQLKCQVDSIPSKKYFSTGDTPFGPLLIGASKNDQGFVMLKPVVQQ